MSPRNLVRMLLAASVATGCLAACTTPPRVDAEAAPTADFSTHQTFAWQESFASYDPPPQATDVAEVTQAIHDAVVEQLAGKGYSEAATGRADFLVSFHLVVNVTEAPELCTRRHLIFGEPELQREFDTYEICQRDAVMAPRKVRKGTLVVFVVDAATRNLLWQGVADGAAGSRRHQVERLREAVQEMFVAFPGVRA
jgi:hypothetical protein